MTTSDRGCIRGSLQWVGLGAAAVSKGKEKVAGLASQSVCVLPPPDQDGIFPCICCSAASLAHFGLFVSDTPANRGFMRFVNLVHQEGAQLTTCRPAACVEVTTECCFMTTI